MTKLNKYRPFFIYCSSFSLCFDTYQITHAHYKRKAVFITEELQEILGSFDSAQIIWYKASKEKSHDSTCTIHLSFDVLLHFTFDLHFTFGLLIEYLVIMDILCWDCLKVIIWFLFKIHQLLNWKILNCLWLISINFIF